MGDVAGAAHSFLFQMLFFAIAHIIMSISFLKEIGEFNLKRNIIPSLIVLAILGSALFFIVPCVQNPYLAGGVIAYTLADSFGCGSYFSDICYAQLALRVVLAGSSP